MRHNRIFGTICTMLSIAGLLVLGACSPDTPAPPTSTATARPTLTPTVEQYQSHQPLVLNPPSTPTSVTLEPTRPSPSSSTPTSTTTITSQPTPTPTPTATPFPPGPATKLGLFVGRNDPQVFELLRTGNVAIIKTLEYDRNFVAEMKQISPGTFIVARYTPLPLPDFSTWNPTQAAQQFADLILPIATEPLRQANIDCWEAYNEPNPSTPEQMASYAIFEAERTRLLAAAGIRSCIGNFSTGQPPLEMWPSFFPALETAQQYEGFLALHEYSAPTMWFGSGPHQLQPGGDEDDEGWLTLRYRKVYRDYLAPAGLAIPLVITETGIDGQVRDRPGPEGLGWQDFGAYWREQGLVSTTDSGFYVEQLAWYDSQLGQDDYVLGAAIYALAAPQGWPTFEIGGPVIPILRQYLSVHPLRSN